MLLLLRMVPADDNDVAVDSAAADANGTLDIVGSEERHQFGRGNAGGL